jgi:hypothetical protein
LGKLGDRTRKEWIEVHIRWDGMGWNGMGRGEVHCSIVQYTATQRSSPVSTVFMVPQIQHGQKRIDLILSSYYHVIFYATQSGNLTLFAEAMAMAYTQQNIEISRGERLDGTGTTTIEGRNRDRELECTFLTRAEDFGEDEEKEKECTRMIGPDDRHKEGEGEKTRARDSKQRGREKQDLTARRRSADSHIVLSSNSESESSSAANNKNGSRSGGDRAESRILGLGLGPDEDGRRREEAKRGGPSISELAALRDRVFEAKAKS